MSDSNPSLPTDSPAVDSSESDKKKKALAKKAAAAERKAAARAVKSGDTSAPAPTSSDSNKASHDHGSNKAEKKPKAEKKAEHAKAIRERSKELPEFVKHRAAVWETVMKRIEEEKKTKLTENKKIQIKLPDGAVKEGVAGVTSAYDIAMGISKKLAERSIIARVNGDKLVDLMAPLHADCQIELLDFESKEGKNTYWHSSAHILGEAIELEYQNAQLCIGPPLDEGGFYYDVHLGDTKVTPEDFKSIESLVEQVRKEKQPFIRAELTKAEALEMFKFNQFKTEIIKTKVPDGAICTAYRCGPLIDLCRGPHIPNTGVIGAMKVTKASSSYWLAKADQPSLQRVYGISFPTEKALAEWEKRMKLAEERDHRKVGLHQQLFFFDDISPGSCFFLPHGARIYNTLCNFIRKEYWKRNYTEVISPNMYNIDLWRTSGHYENYKENMFLFEVEKQEFGLKPMNCPGHCMMFKAMLHSYRDLPLRYADFGVLHRNELSGALTGLTRVRRFQQDDAHIFCRRDQIEQEVSSVLDMLKHCYGIFGFQYSLALSTRPEKHLGEPALWDQAEKQLETVLNKFCDANEMKWALNPGDGAFYGPKIDIRLTDALGRHHQCATIQLDFQLPIRFDLGYKTNEDKLERPVMIHRAILGSVERMIAVLTEHTGGKWPFWLSPRQAMIVPVSPSLNDYAELVRKAVHEAGFYVDIDDSTKQFPRKIREAQLQQYNLILVVGEQEKNENSVTVRYRIDNVEAEEVNNKKSKKDGKEQKEADGKDEEKKKFEAQQTKFTINDLLKHMNELLNSHK